MTLRELHEAARPPKWFQDDRWTDRRYLGIPRGEGKAPRLVLIGNEADAALIAAMRNALPLLLDVVDAARAASEHFETAADDDECADNLDRALAALDGAE